MSSEEPPSFAMPDAPAAPARRGLGSDNAVQSWIRGGASFTLMIVSFLLIVWAIGIFAEPLLGVYDPELRERHDEFKHLSGFDNVPQRVQALTYVLSILDLMPTTPTYLT